MINSFFSFAVFAVLFSGSVVAQSKKDQIQMLQARIDSLASNLDFTRDQLDKTAGELVVCSALSYENDARFKEELHSKSEAFQILKDENEKIKFELVLLKDSLIKSGDRAENLSSQLIKITNEKHLLKAELDENSEVLKVDSINSEFKVTYKILNKPAKVEMNDLHDWLSQFTLICENEISFFDSHIAKFYGGEDPLDVHGNVSISTAVYKEGIIYIRRVEYEGVNYELFVPLFDKPDFKRIIDRLCRTMGMCNPPEEMDIRCEETDYGIKVYWGGGC